MKKRQLILIPLAVLLFLLGISRLESGQSRRGAEQLEEAVRATAVSCYASEGFYPPDIAYMRQHYGLQYDEDRYIVRYEIFASNLMPDITILVKTP